MQELQLILLQSSKLLDQVPDVPTLSAKEIRINALGTVVQLLLVEHYRMHYH
jgi:hypothetical protein